MVVLPKRGSGSYACFTCCQERENQQPGSNANALFPMVGDLVRGDQLGGMAAGAPLSGQFLPSRQLLAHNNSVSVLPRVCCALNSCASLAAANKRLNTAYLPKETFGQLRDYRRAKVLRELAHEPQVATAQAV